MSFSSNDSVQVGLIEPISFEKGAANDFPKSRGIFHSNKKL